MRAARGGLDVRGLGALSLALVACGEPAVEPPCAPATLASAPALLSETGLFADLAGKVLDPANAPFEPRFPLWSDGLEKRRAIFVPPCAEIDESDPDHWSFPFGTRLWKSFLVEGRWIETRLITRFGPGPDDFLFAAYRWNEDESDAEWVPAGERDARGTSHDIPSSEACLACHGHLRERVLGYGAIQLGAFAVPGDAATRAGLGYLHANCGPCHNDDGVRFVTPFLLRLSARDVRPEDTATFRTAVGVPVEKFVWPGVTQRIARGQPEASCVFLRTGRRGDPSQMPPLATELVDDEGHETLRAFISGLPP
jgi:hypothetical protein